MDEMKMMISGVISKDGVSKVCVYFEDGEKYAEGYVPDCKIEKFSGFTDEEICMLEDYLTDNLETIKRHAAEVDPIRKMMREEA